VANVVSGVTVKLNNLNHTSPDNVDLLLVGPLGQKFILLSDAIGDRDAVGINYTLTDSAFQFVPIVSTPMSGIFRSTNYGICQDPFPPPAPSGPYISPGGSTCGTASLNATFAGLDPNGLWQLFVVDDASADVGNFSGGWEISFITTSNVCSTAVTAVSRKSHGATPYDISLPLVGSSGSECRSGGAGNNYQVVVTFANAVTFASAGVTSGTGTVASTGGSGTTALTANLTGITSGQTSIVTLFDVSDGVSSNDLAIPLVVLIGDTSGNRIVNATDVAQTKAQSGQPVIGSNFRTDVNASGTVNATDISLVKSRSGNSLPP